MTPLFRQNKIALSMRTLHLSGENLTLELLAQIAQGRELHLAIDPPAIPRIQKSRAVVEAALQNHQIAYGINTGFGKLADVRIGPEDIRTLQLNLVRSHACGVGEPLSREAVRALMAIRANSLIRGYSGVRLEVIERLLEFLNKNVIPEIPSRGSVGASGDLAPSAHMVLALIGEGRVCYKGRIQPSIIALKQAQIEPLSLEAKEGLALLNGTQAMTALGALAVRAARRIINAADLAGAFSLEVLMGTVRAFDLRLQDLRAHPGQRVSAENVLRLTRNSKIMESHKDCGRIQDAYSLRCIPQVHGAVRDAIEHAGRVVTTEINSVTDNPIIFPDTGEIVSCGNFHGEPLALVLDYLAIAVTEVSTISERRLERLVNPDLSGLPAFLAKTPGITSGLMINQVVAAALASENKVYSHPASVDSIPTSGGKEDHVSMGMHGALKLQPILRNTRFVLANELLCAAQALDFLKPLAPGEGTQKVYDFIRQAIPFLEEDQPTTGYLEWLEENIREGSFDCFL